MTRLPVAHLNLGQGKFSIFNFTLFFLFCTPVFSQTHGAFDSTLATVKSLFDSGSYISCELQTRRALEEKNIPATTRVQLEKYLAFSLVAEGRNDDAVEHFENALRIDSSLTLDTVLTSPKILGFFEKAKNQYLTDKLKEESQKKSETSEGNRNLSRSLPDSVAQSKRVSLGEHGGAREGPTFRAILFPGWEQVYQGKETKGYVLLGAGAVAALSAITTGLLSRNARTNYLSATTAGLASSRYKTYNLYYQAEYYSISAFVLIYVYSAFDSFVDLPPYLGIDYSPKTLTTEFQFHIPF